MSATDYLDLVAARARLMNSLSARTAGFDAVIMPTVPIAPPPIAELENEQEYNHLNLLILRNTMVGNFFDRCAISIPCHRPGEAPAGLMLMGETMGDQRLFSIAAAAEPLLA
ncbi:MAG: hypothetical protein JO227_17830 [Acetobacteraceae bacterium]|nr:hypothetical protein [Acetobacteraceae bacterium]